LCGHHGVYEVLELDDYRLVAFLEALHPSQVLSELLFKAARLRTVSD
jgi:hypothetical protein